MFLISRVPIKVASAAQRGAAMSNSGSGCNEEANLQTFEKRLGRPVRAILGLSYEAL